MVLVESSLSMRKSILAAYWFIRCLLLLRRATATCKLSTLVIVKVPYFFILPFKSYVIVFFQNATSLNFFSGMRNYFLYLKFRLFTRARKEETSGRSCVEIVLVNASKTLSSQRQILIEFDGNFHSFPLKINLV